MDRLHFNFRRKSKGTSLAQWLIPSRFQFPALESQGIRLLQRRILAEVNVFCPSFILESGEAFLALCCRCQPLFPPSQKNPKPNIQSPKQSCNYSLGNTLPWKFQSLDVQSYRSGAVRAFPRMCLAPSLDNVLSCPRVSPTLMLQDVFYIQTHTYSNSKPSKNQQ